MTIQSVKCEDFQVGFTNGANVSTDPAAHLFDPTRLRQVYLLSHANGAVDDWRNEDGSVIALDSFWYQIDWAGNKNGTSGAEESVFLLRDSANGRDLFEVHGHWSGGQMWMRYWNGSGWVEVPNSRVNNMIGFQNGQPPRRLRVRVKIHATDGAFEFWIGATKVAGMYGNTKFTASTTCDQARVFGHGDGWDDSRKTAVSGLVLASYDEDPLDIQYCSVPVNAAGDANTMASGDVTSLAENVHDASTVVYGSAGQSILGKTPALPANMQQLRLAGAILAVAAGRGTGAAPTNVQRRFRPAVGGIDYSGGNVALPETTRIPTQLRMAINPATGAPWVAADFGPAAGQFGFTFQA